MSFSAYQIVSNESAPAQVAPNTDENVDIQAPSGKKVLSGGYYLGPASAGDVELFVVSGSYPTDAGDTWRVRVFNRHSSIDCEVTAYAICADVD